MLAFPIFRLGIGGGEKKKLSFFFFLAFRPRSQASLACSSIFKKKKENVCVQLGHGCSNAPIVSTVNPLLSPPRQDSFFSDSFEGRLNREGGLIYLEKTVVSVLYKELEYKAEKPKY